MMKKFLESWRIYLLSLLIPLSHATLGRPCGTWKRPERCGSIAEYFNAVILEPRLHNLPIIFAFILSIFTLTSIRFFVKGKKRLSLLFLILTLVPIMVMLWFFR